MTNDLRQLSERILRYYEQFDEKERLSDAWGQLELVRTQEILERRLPEPPAVILDVGGAAGRYAAWLARLRYEVHLVDPVARLVAQAERASRAQPEAPLASCRVGDARALDFADATADAVLMFGPLYHLQDQDDRLRALREARRTLSSGGLLFAVAISRFASAVDGLVRGFVRDPEFVKIVERDLRDGRHTNPTDNLCYFTDAYFHQPAELEAEIEHAGLEHEETLAIDGLGCLLQNLGQYWEDDVLRARLLGILRAVEAEPALLGVSAHIMVVARRPPAP